MITYAIIENTIPECTIFPVSLKITTKLIVKCPIRTANGIISYHKKKSINFELIRSSSIQTIGCVQNFIWRGISDDQGRVLQSELLTANKNPLPDQKTGEWLHVYSEVSSLTK